MQVSSSCSECFSAKEIATYGIQVVHMQAITKQPDFATSPINVVLRRMTAHPLKHSILDHYATALALSHIQDFGQQMQDMQTWHSFADEEFKSLPSQYTFQTRFEWSLNEKKFQEDLKIALEVWRHALQNPTASAFIEAEQAFCRPLTIFQKTLQLRAYTTPKPMRKKKYTLDSFVDQEPIDSVKKNAKSQNISQEAQRFFNEQKMPQHLHDM